MWRVAFRFLFALFVLLLVWAATSFAQMKPGDRRKAYGEARASVIESVLTTLYPGAQVQWDPALMVKIPGQQPRMVDVAVYVRGAAAGGAEGIASVEFEKKKEQFIFEAQGFRRTDSAVFPTVLIVYRTDASFHINKYKEIPLDPAEPLTELKTMSIQDWSRTEWPTLDIQYDTHRTSPGAFITIEWRSTFDANSGEFISRLPFGITRKVRGGPEQQYNFSIGRNSPGSIQIGDRYSGEIHQYACSDPCVVEANRLLSQWIQ